MARRKLPRSIRKYLRLEKARIRRTIADLQEQERRIMELVTRYHSAS
ncbi:MAG: hypothetical protein AB1352_05815 [Patescibacteria group bacterium]